MQRKRILPGLLGILLVTLGLAFGARGSDWKIKGIIISRTGDTLILNTQAQGKITVKLTDSTKTIDKKGLFGLESHELSNTVLIPGLKVEIEGTGRTDSPGGLVAEKIITDGDDLETAQMIQAGLHPTAEQRYQCCEH